VGKSKEPLVIREDPQEVTRLLKSTEKDIKDLKAEFDAVHVKAMDALKSHDYRAFDKAIAAEHAIIDKQRDLIDKCRKK
jgi:hypothetical protein